MINKTVRIKFEGDDVVIDIIAPEETTAVPAMGIIVNEPAKQEKVKTARRVKKATVKPVVEKKPGSGKGKRISQEVIDQIKMLRDDQAMTSKQISEELGVSLSTVNKYYQIK